MARSEQLTINAGHSWISPAWRLPGGWPAGCRFTVLNPAGVELVHVPLAIDTKNPEIGLARLTRAEVNKLHATGHYVLRGELTAADQLLHAVTLTILDH